MTMDALPAAVKKPNPIQALARGLVALIWTVLSGWAGLARRGFITGLIYFKSLPLGQGIFLVACLGMMVTALPGWVVYSVNFGEPETVRIGSTYRLLFILPGLSGLVLALSVFRFRYPLFLFLYGVSAATYLAGFVFPNPVHTEIVRADDFSLTFWVYLYALVLIAGGVFSRQGLTIPLFDWNILFKPLSEEK